MKSWQFFSFQLPTMLPMHSKPMQTISRTDMSTHRKKEEQ